MSDIELERKEPEEKRISVRWKNRQRMAWLSFWFMIFFTFTLWFVLPVWYNYMGVEAQQWTDQITDSSGWLYGAFASVILGYMGTTAMMVSGKKISINEEDY